MPKRKIKHLLALKVLSLLTISLILVIGIDFKAESMVADFLERKLPDHIQLDYKQMDVNVLTGTVELKDMNIVLLDRDAMRIHTTIHMDAFALEEFGYGQFLFKKNIRVAGLNFLRPKVRHYLHGVEGKDTGERPDVLNFSKTIEIGKLKVVDGHLDLLQEGKDSIVFVAESINFDLGQAMTGPEQIKKNMPFAYDSYQLSTEHIFLDLGPYEQLRVAAIVLEDGNATLKELNLNSKFSKVALSKNINTERDHISLKVPEATLNIIKFGFKNDTLFFNTELGNISRPTAEIYRDKLVDDDLTEKRLYSRMLRELPIHLNIAKIEITDGALVYSEQVETITPPDKISFDKLSAVLLNISNDSKIDKKTTISAEARLMDHAPITLDWTFDVFKENDAFMASGVIKNFKTKSINAFLESNLRVKSKGTINRMYFTISGDVISSAGDMKMKYEDFEFAVLKKDRSSVNKLWTFIGKIFINDGSNADASGFRYGSIEVERDPTKSFFNYLWLNVQDGTANTLIGKSRKK